MPPNGGPGATNVATSPTPSGRGTPAPSPQRRARRATRVDDPPLGEQGEHLVGLLAGRSRVEHQVRRERRLPRVVDAGEPGELAGTGLRVEPLRVAPLALVEGGRDVDLEERHAG